MISLLKQINYLKNWDYYNRKNNQKIQDWNDEQEHRKFIEDFFEISKKENILNDFKIEIDDLYYLKQILKEKQNDLLKIS